VTTACETVVVSMVEIDEVEVFPSVITLVTGDTATASAVVTASGGTEVSGIAMTWTVDDPTVASVSSDGVVEARAPGNTTVRASSDGVSGAASVRVLAAPGSEPDPPDPPDPDCDFRDRVFVGTFVVERGVECVLTDVRVLGDLRVEEGATLVATRLTVTGRLEASRATQLVLDDARLFDELRFERGGSVTIRDSEMERKVRLKENVGSIDVSDSRIDDALQLEDNRGGPFTLYRNTTEKLECKENDPPPTGDGNVIEGSGGSGQCAGL
jgi:hypothetical protein